jgi:hypothetical protein
MNDAIALLGFAGLAVGLWWIYPPAALVACGSLLLLLGCSGATNDRRRQAIAKRLERIELARSRGEPIRDGIYDPEGNG